MNPIMSFSSIEPGAFFAMHEVSMGVARSYAKLMRLGRIFPPVVAVVYDGRAMPLDGHHRLTAAAINGAKMPAWLIDGDDFEDLCERRRTAGRSDPDMALIRMADRADRCRGKAIHKLAADALGE